MSLGSRRWRVTSWPRGRSSLAISSSLPTSLYWDYDGGCLLLRLSSRPLGKLQRSILSCFCILRDTKSWSRDDHVWLRVSWLFSYWGSCFFVNGGRECSASALKAETARVRRKRLIRAHSWVLFVSPRSFRFLIGSHCCCFHRMLAFSGSEECRTLPARHSISRVAPKCWMPRLLDVFTWTLHVLSWCSGEVLCSDRDSLAVQISDSALMSFTMLLTGVSDGLLSKLLQSFLLIVLMLILLVICSRGVPWCWCLAPVFRLVDQLAYTLSCFPIFRRTRPCLEALGAYWPISPSAEKHVRSGVGHGSPPGFEHSRQS